MYLVLILQHGDHFLESLGDHGDQHGLFGTVKHGTEGHETGLSGAGLIADNGIADKGQEIGQHWILDHFTNDL